MSIRLGSRVVHNGYLDGELKNKVGTVVARDKDGWLLVQFDDYSLGHDGELSITTRVKKGFTSGNSDCWWSPEKALDKVKQGGVQL